MATNAMNRMAAAGIPVSMLVCAAREGGLQVHRSWSADGMAWTEGAYLGHRGELWAHRPRPAI